MGTVSSGRGISFFGLLGVLFVGLKLTGYIDWSWFWVLLPITFPLIFAAIVWLGIVIAIIGSNNE